MNIINSESTEKFYLPYNFEVNIKYSIFDRIFHSKIAIILRIY